MGGFSTQTGWNMNGLRDEVERIRAAWMDGWKVLFVLWTGHAHGNWNGVVYVLSVVRYGYQHCSFSRARITVSDRAM